MTDGNGWDGSGGAASGRSVRDGSARRFAWPAVVAVLALAVAVLVGVLIGRSDGPAPVAAAPTTTTPAAVTTTAPTTTSDVATPVPATTTTTPAVACGVDLGAAAVSAAIASLPVEPQTGAGWASSAVEGNYDPCATLSTALVVVEGGTGSSPVQALMFHEGEYLGTGTSQAYGFTTFDAGSTTDDTVVLRYKTPGSCNACDDGTSASVRYQWDGSRVQMLDPAPDQRGGAVTTTEPACRGVNCPPPGVPGNVGGPRGRGIPFVSCPLDQEYGTGLYADGQLDYAPECLRGGSGGR